MQTDVFSSSYKRIADSLRDRIAGGDLPVGSRLPSVREIAREERVSTFTISKALACLKNDGYIRSFSRRGYQVIDRSPDIVRTYRVGILVPFTPAAAAESMERELASFQHGLIERNHRMTVHSACWYPILGPSERFASAESIGAYELDAFIVAGIYSTNYLADIAKLDRPTVVWDMDATALGIDSAVIDNVWASFELTRRLIESGHRRIAYIGGPRIGAFEKRYRHAVDPSAAERAQGYELAMRTFAPESMPACFRADGRTDADWRNTLKRFLEGNREHTAIVSETLFDPKTLGDAKLVQAGFMDSGGDIPPGTAVVAVCDMDLLAKRAVNMLLERMDGEAPKARRLAIKPIIREG